MEKVVKRIPIKAVLEISLDGKSAAIIFEDENGGEYVLNYLDFNDERRNLDVIELRAPNT